MPPAYCRTCVLPDTRPGVALDDSGECNGCRNAAAKRTIDWDARAERFRVLAEEARSAGRTWDCVVPVSGGKDSYWQVVTCLEHDLRPLAVTYATPRRSALGERNLRTLVEIGVDHLELRVDPEVERAFVARAFRETATSGLPAHMAIYAWPLQVALSHDVPLVVYGENSAFEYGSDEPGLAGSRVDRRWLARFGVTGGTTAADWVGGDLTPRALAPYARPDEETLTRAGVSAVFLGWFFPWDPLHSLEIALKHGFAAREEGPRVGHYDFVNIDDDMIGVHHHAKWHKFGITRSWDTLSMEIRAGRTTRDAAIAELRDSGDETPWADIAVFCDYVGMSPDEYFEVLERFRNPEVWSSDGGTWRIDGFLVEDFEWPESPPLPPPGWPERP